MNNIIASSPNIQWNISNCEIQTIMIWSDYKVLSFQYKRYYKIINKCDQSVMSTYSENNIWDLTLIWIIVWIVILARIVFS